MRVPRGLRLTLLMTVALASYGSLRTMHAVVEHAPRVASAPQVEPGAQKQCPDAPSRPGRNTSDENCPECSMPSARAGLALVANAPFALAAARGLLWTAEIESVVVADGRLPVSRGPPA